MNEVDRLWAGWRAEYVGNTHSYGHVECVFCGLINSDLPARETYIVWRDETVVAILNAYPYGTGHVLILPVRHVSELHELTEDESARLWQVTRKADQVIRAVYKPDGSNIGLNLGKAAGAGLPDHLHFHALPRWKADANFVTAVANTRVLPEALDATWEKLSSAWG